MVLPQKKFLENLKFLQLEFFCKLYLLLLQRPHHTLILKIGKTMKASTIESLVFKQLQIAAFL